MIPQQDARKALIAEWRRDADLHERANEPRHMGDTFYAGNRAATATLRQCADRLEALSESSGYSKKPHLSSVEALASLRSLVRTEAGHIAYFDDALDAVVEALRAENAASSETQEEAVEPLRRWIQRERALRDAFGKGGQSVGDSPRISPSVLKELERLIAPLVAQPSPSQPAETPEERKYA